MHARGASSRHANHPPRPHALLAAPSVPRARNYANTAASQRHRIMECEPSQTSILRISDEKTLQLIISYGQEPCLWNTTHDSYKNKDVRAAAAQRIADKLNVKHFTARHVMIKFKNLRNSYCQELKKIATSLEDGCTGEDVYRPRVLWFHHMDSYLRPHLQPTRTKLIVDTMTGDWIDKETKPSANCRTIEIKEEVDADSDSNHDHEDWVGVGVPQPEVMLHAAPDYSDDTPAKRARRETEESVHESNSPTSDVLKSIAASLEQMSRQKEDQFDHFGRYVASALRALPPAHAQAVQPRMVRLLTHTPADGVQWWL